MIQYVYSDLIFMLRDLLCVQQLVSDEKNIGRDQYVGKINFQTGKMARNNF